MIHCQICNQQMNTITWKHLLHHSLTLAEYKQQFPHAPVRSEEATLRKKEAATRSNLHRKGVARSEEVKRKIRDTKATQDIVAWNKGIARTEHQRQQQSATVKAQYDSGQRIHHMLGKHHSEETKAKIRTTSLMQCRVYAEESKQKRSITMEQKILSGWINPCTTAEVIEKRRQTVLNRYGVEHHMQRHISPEVLAKLNDKDWLYNQHVTQKKPITQICVDLGLHWKNANSSVRSRLHKFGIEQQYHFSSSYPERELTQILTDWGLEVTTNTRAIIKPKELDLYVASKQVAIEYCGLIWHSSAFIFNPDYHAIKVNACSERSISLVTIFEDDWIHKRDQVIFHLEHVFDIDKPVLDLSECEIGPVKSEDKSTFLEKYHLHGDSADQYALGIYANNMLVTVLTFSVSDDVSVGRFISTHNLSSQLSLLIDYIRQLVGNVLITAIVDRSLGVDQLYLEAGFAATQLLPPQQSVVDLDIISRCLPTNETTGSYVIFDCGYQQYTLI